MVHLQPWHVELQCNGLGPHNSGAGKGAMWVGCVRDIVVTIMTYAVHYTRLEVKTHSSDQ